MYKENELAIVIPTKDRPLQVESMLASIERQTKLPGLIVIIDSGGKSEEVVRKYIDHLPIVYENTDIAGQIAQRNMGIGLVSKQYRLICNLDDDIILEEEAIENMVDCWSRQETETAGIAFNIINNPPYKNITIKKLIYMGSESPGKILASGYNVPVNEDNETISSEWLCGGATVWKMSILDEYKRDAIKSKWAICEDIIFSYPISKKYPLYICQDSRVFHDDQPVTRKIDIRNIYRGKNATLWRLYFVEQHEELSRIKFTWMIIAQTIIRSIAGLIGIRPNNILFALGQLQALLIGHFTIMTGKSVITLIDE